MNGHRHDHGGVHDDHDHHGHDHRGHDHKGHDHHGHAHASPDDPRYGLAIALNLTIVLAEAGGGVIAHSTALVADAGHNLSDVLGLVLAGGAAWLARRPAAGRRTYGFGKATVMAALANGLVLMLVSGALVFEAARRLIHPQPIHAPLVMGIALIGVVVNTLTALMFVRGHSDVNVRGVFLHMGGDAAISVGVVITAGLILLTGWTWLDPVVSIAIVAVIVLGTWGLLREAIDMALDAAPRGADPASIADFLRASPGVTEVHDLHIWAMSTTETALTAHLVRPEPDGLDQFRSGLAQALKSRFGVHHATLQIEQSRGEHCPGC
ncbi:MAG TPA: cation diffusion facilitator family transporter [Caulobacteraceae bacterium]|jgi:cobalt-zinc-cadmium efflux system protein|nr:cation diffusion facilitator family transporter [Caulobacteraceae bacterium]